MKIKQKSFAGSLDSSDVLVKLEPQANALNTIEISSPYLQQFGHQIYKLCETVLNEHNLDHVHLFVQDQGAIEPVLTARLKTAINRAL